MDYKSILLHFYPTDTPLRRLLVVHSDCVRRKALAILENAPSDIRKMVDTEVVESGAMLHDIGICRCSAPDILCEGTEPYIAHGVIGARMLRELSGVGDMEPFARICERHTGSGLTAAEIVEQGLPIAPVKDYLPETLEEKLICLADKFYSKSGNPEAEKPLEKVRSSMARFGEATLLRFDQMCSLFNLHP